MRKKRAKTKEEKVAEEYFPVDETDLKIAIEKEYKKPERKSLEKVEKKARKKKVMPKKKTKYSPPKIKLKKDSYELIITEKPQAALKIASALGKSTKKINGGVPYYVVSRDGKKIFIACAVGHLFALKQKNSRAELPVFDLVWVPNYLVRKRDFSKKYYNTILKLVKEAGSITIAMDYDVEGELIGLNVVRFICNQKDAGRMKFSTLTDKELNQAYENKSPHLDWGQAIAGETRHYLDWFYGINLSRALMNAIKKTGKFKIMSIGRVQGPALNLIVQREKKIQAFKPVPYWQIFIKVKNSHILELKYNKDIFKKPELKKFEDLKGKTAQAKTTKTERAIKPPPPFNLTTLQTEAYKFYKITPVRTLQIAQSLYLNGLISYPRTSSQKLPESIGYKEILKKLAKKYKAEKLITRRKPVEGGKSDPAHPCFTEETKITLKNKETTFSEIGKKVKKWKYNKNKNYFYSDIKILDVVSYDHKNKSNAFSKGYRIFKTPIDSKLIHLKDVNLKITQNHPIYSITKKGVGHTIAGELKNGDYIFKKKKISTKKYRPKITKENILEAYSEKHQKEIIQKDKSRILQNYKKIKKFLKELTLKEAILLAKIIGFCNGDGHIHFQRPSNGREKYPSVTFIGKKEDMKTLRKDINYLGFSCYLIKKDGQHSYLSSKDSVFGRTLIALGCPPGDKISTEFNIPKWIINASKEIKSAFLGGLFSAELTKTRIHIKNPRDIRPFSFNQHKIKKFEKSFQNYLINLKKILKQLKIETNKIRFRNRIKRKKDNELTIEGGLDIKNNRANLINFLSTIDFGYCRYKEKSYRKALAYLLQREIAISYKRKLRKRAKKLHLKGNSFKKIGEIIGVSKYTIKGWIYYKKARREDHVSINDIKKFKDFWGEVPEDCTPIKINNKRVIQFKGFVYDLEIEGTHTFFSNGILVHNCVYPTGETQILSRDDEKIYNLIVKRFLAVFCDEAIIENKKITASFGNLYFSAKGSSIKRKAWTEIYPFKLQEKEIPDLEGEVKVIDLRIEEKETQPPRRYTPASIISELTKRKLGTKTTRASILETLYGRDYIREKSIEATPLGISLIETLEKHSPIIIDEKLTRKFENEMTQIQKSKKQLDKKGQKIIEEAKQAIIKIMAGFKEKEKEIGIELLVANAKLIEQKRKENILNICPICKKGNLIINYSKKNKRYFVSCNKYPKCRTTFTLPPRGLIKRTNRVCDECGFPKLLLLKKRRRPWEFCFNPTCPTNKERIAGYKEGKTS